MKNIAILGSTGYIGRQSLEVIDFLGSAYNVVALAAGSNYRLLKEQIDRYKPEAVSLANEQAAAEFLRTGGCGKTCCFIGGPPGQIEIATWPTADIVIMAQVGFSGFEPFLAALKNGKTIALANKESLVVGGEIAAKQGLLKKDKLLPLDSEHSAIWQCLFGSDISEVKNIYLTASGGPFYEKNKEFLENVTPQMALHHPTWQMGSKITVDSATMMNKGLEVIEAKWLFGLSAEQIKVIIHRQSVVHSLVEYVDGSCIAQLGNPDMRIPIQYALTYPERKPYKGEAFSFTGLNLTFDEPDRVNFPALNLAYRALSLSGSMPAVLNGANETCVGKFLNHSIKFTDIACVVDFVMKEHRLVIDPGVNDIIEADRWSRLKAAEIIKELTDRVN